jgi:phosphinothricin acetyltransferase
MMFTIGELNRRQWEQVRAVYLEGLATGQATFETEAPGWEEWDAAHLPFARLVAKAGGAGGDEGGEVLGWAALSPVSRRRVYEGVAEVSVYVAARARGRGVGSALLRALVSESERGGVWTLQAGVFPENAASVALHARCGFREVGRRERIGRLQGLWRDTLLLERRSGRVGTD